MDRTDENGGPTNNHMNPPAKKTPGLDLPSKNEVAAAIAAVQFRGQTAKLKDPIERRHEDHTNMDGKKYISHNDGESTLFQQSSAKLHSFSFGSDITGTTSGIPSSTRESIVSNLNNTKRLSLSTTQLRARKIMNDAQYKKSTHLITQTDEVDSDASTTDDSSVLNVDPKTIAQVSDFIDFLQNKKNTSIEDDTAMRKALSSISPTAYNATNQVGSIQSLLTDPRRTISTSSRVKETGVEQLRILASTEAANNASFKEESTPRRGNSIRSPIAMVSPRNTQLTSSVDVPKRHLTSVPPYRTVQLGVGLNKTINDHEIINNGAFYLHPETSAGIKHADGSDLSLSYDSSSTGSVAESTRKEIDSFIDSLNGRTSQKQIPTNTSKNALDNIQNHRNGVKAEKRVYHETEDELNRFIASICPLQTGTIKVPLPSVPNIHAKANIKIPENEVKIDSILGDATDVNKVRGHYTSHDTNVVSKGIGNKKEIPAATTHLEETSNLSFSSVCNPTEEIKKLHPTSVSSSDCIAKKRYTDKSIVDEKKAASSSSNRANHSPSPLLLSTKSITSAPLTIRRDKNKYESPEDSLAYISSLIKELVRSNDPPMTLGKILAEANKRGLSLAIVTEMYKTERSNASSEKLARKESSVCNSVAHSSVKERGTSEQKNIGVDSSLVVDSSCFLPDTPRQLAMKARLSVKAPTEYVTSKRENISKVTKVQSPQAQSASKKVTAINDHSTITQNHLKPTISNELAGDVKKLNHLCNEAVSLISLNLNEDSQKSRASADHSKVPTVVEKMEEILVFPQIDDIKHHEKSKVTTMHTDLEGVDVLKDMKDMERRVKAAVRSENPSEEFGLILADAKMKRVSITSLVALYTKERMILTSDDSKSKISSANVDVVVEGSNEAQERNLDGPDDDSTSNLDPVAHPGLSDTQLVQLKHLLDNAENMRGCDTIVNNHIHSETEHSSAHDTSMRKNDQKLEDIDEFFTRFSIQMDQKNGVEDVKTFEKSSVESNETSEQEKKFGLLDSKKDKKSVNGLNELNVESKKTNKAYASRESLTISPISDRGKVAEFKSHKNGDGTLLFMQTSSLEVEFIESMEEKPKVKKKPQDRKKEKKRKSKQQDNRKVIRLRDDLPGRFGLWRSPWGLNERSDFSKKTSINGVAAAARFAHRRGTLRQRHFLLPKEERVNGHVGFMDIDFYSLYESTLVMAEDQEIDLAPWEFRDVRQRFLNEKSVECRNWFGTFEVKRGNDRVHHPVSRPKSLRMSVTRIPDPEEWSEDWYTTWKTRRDNPNNLVSFLLQEASKTQPDNDSISSVNESISSESSDSSLPETIDLRKRVIIEIGTLCPVRVKAGERVSRIHPEYTSSLRVSTWRKKYLKGALFPGN